MSGKDKHKTLPKMDEQDLERLLGALEEVSRRESQADDEDSEFEGSFTHKLPPYPEDDDEDLNFLQQQNRHFEFQGMVHDEPPPFDPNAVDHELIAKLNAMLPDDDMTLSSQRDLPPPLEVRSYEDSAYDILTSPEPDRLHPQSTDDDSDSDDNFNRRPLNRVEIEPPVPAFHPHETQPPRPSHPEPMKPLKEPTGAHPPRPSHPEKPGVFPRKPAAKPVSEQNWQNERAGKFSNNQEELDDKLGQEEKRLMAHMGRHVEVDQGKLMEERKKVFQQQQREREREREREQQEQRERDQQQARERLQRQREDDENQRARQKQQTQQNTRMQTQYDVAPQQPSRPISTIYNQEYEPQQPSRPVSTMYQQEPQQPSRPVSSMYQQEPQQPSRPVSTMYQREPQQPSRPVSTMAQREPQQPSSTQQQRPVVTTGQKQPAQAQTQAQAPPAVSRTSTAEEARINDDRKAREAEEWRVREEMQKRNSLLPRALHVKLTQSRGDHEIKFSELTFGDKLGLVGSTGESWKGRKTGESSEVVIKKFKYQNMDDQFLNDFSNEAADLVNLRHEGVSRLVGICTYEDLYAVQPYEEGKPLAVACRLSDFANVTPTNILLLIRQIVDAMAFLHSNNVLHRNLKPSSIIISPDMSTIKIKDFGFLKIKDYITTIGSFQEIEYQAPEIITKIMIGQNEKYSDVYSFAIIVAEIYLRAAPFGALNPKQIAAGVVNSRLRPKLPNACPFSVGKVIESSWQQEGEKRPGFAQLSRVFSTPPETLLSYGGSS